MSFEGFPIVMGLELTLACNLRCMHCASSATGITRRDELSLDEILGICDQFQDLFVREVDLTGGEPLLRPEWQQVTEHLRRMDIPVRMVTNGFLLEENAQRLADSGIATVGVSLDGPEKTHDHIRQKPGLFRRIISGIEAALDKNVPVAVITAVNDMNIDQLPALKTILQDLGIRHWQLQPLFSLGRARSDGLKLSCSTYLELGKYVHRQAPRCHAEGITLMPADGVGYFTDLDTRDRLWAGCSAGISSCGITSDGNVKGCLSLPEQFNEGSLRERDLWSIWFDEKSFSWNRKFSTGDLGENCRQCVHGPQCKGGCSVMSFASSGMLHNDPYCFHRLSSRNHPL